eukprot:scaffold5980_cov145-Isochrysis_galbana.AAC.6
MERDSVEAFEEEKRGQHTVRCGVGANDLVKIANQPTNDSRCCEPSPLERRRLASQQVQQPQLRSANSATAQSVQPGRASAAMQASGAPGYKAVHK